MSSIAIKANLFPIPVVRLILTDAHGRVLLLKRVMTKYAEGFWCLPGGKVDYGQTVAESIKNELREETGLICEKYNFLFYQDSLPLKNQEIHCINLYFECAWTGKIRLNEESCDFVWVAHSELGGYAIAFKNDLALKEYWEEK